MTENALSDDDLKLLATSDAEIRVNLEKFSFDIDAFLKRLSQGERWQQLLVAHLFFEHVVSELLSEALPQPDEMDVSRLPFAQRVNLCAALGLLPTEMLPAIKVINRLRNRAAHKLDFLVSRKHVADLINVVPPFLKDAVTSSQDRQETGPIRFHEALYAVILQVDIFRQHHGVQRKLGEKASIRLRSVLDKDPRAKFVP
ncbi:MULTISPECIES: hypothetical protein [unclassified Marinovum]|uniref:hypothetical protein n=1 Tax=unclassified Marinovum TaxID=2647166 RepID=UPI0026E34469|nr:MULTISPECIES: hypothetical protein [unclassified Marinovum]MDO6780324.1 hypothetical protein [Marinovum sp. 1_MG-2023]